MQDSELHNGSGVYLHMVQLLQQNEDAASQGLAADLIQAMLSSYSNLAASGMMSASPKVLNVPHVPPAFDCTRLLEIITSSSNLKVPALGPFVLVLLLSNINLVQCALAGSSIKLHFRQFSLAIHLILVILLTSAAC